MWSSLVQIFHALTWQRRSEEIRNRREYDSDKVEAVKLFLTGDDEVAAALGFEKLELEKEVEQSKGSEEGKRGYL